MKMTFPFLAGVLALSLAACGDSDSNHQAKFSLAVTDAPVDDAEEVVVTFVGVELQSQGGDAQDDEDGDGNSPTSFMFDEPQTIDLLELQGEQSAFLVSDESIPTGVYKIRLLVDAIDQSCQNPTGEEASYVTIDGTSYPLGVPSGELFINKSLTIAAGGQAAYTVDFDLRKSLAERGSTGCYNLRPTALRVVDNATVGTLTGQVDGALLVDDSCPNADPTTGEGAAVYVFSGGMTTPDDEAAELVTTALLEPQTVAEGEAPTGNFDYTVGFLLTGDYTAAFTCQAGDDVPDQDDDITFQQVAEGIAVEEGQTETVDFSAQPAP